MSQRSKAKAALKREREKRQKEMEEAALQRKWENLTKQVGGFSRSGEVKAKVRSKRVEPLAPIRPQSSLKVVERNKYDEYRVSSDKEVVRLSPEMQRREDAAKARYEEMKKMTIPLYNKGGYQMPTPADVEAMKQGGLRRRS